MAGIDIFGQFPNSKMAWAVKAGQSRLITGEVTSMAASYNPASSPGGVAGGGNTGIVAGGPGTLSGVATLNTAGTKNTAALLAACGLTSSFTSLSVGVMASALGVTIAQGSGSNVYQQGAILNFSNISAANSPLTITMAANDVVTLTYSGV